MWGKGLDDGGIASADDHLVEANAVCKQVSGASAERGHRRDEPMRLLVRTGPQSLSSGRRRQEALVAVS